MVDLSSEATTLPRSLLWRVVLPGVLGVTTLLAGTIGTYQYLTATYPELSTAERVLEAIHLSITYFGLGSGPFPDAVLPPLALLARFTGAGFVFYAAVLGVSLLLATRLRPIELGARYRGARMLGADQAAAGHTIVCGLTEAGMTVATDLAAAGDRVVAIAPDAPPGTIRQAREAGVTVFEGDPASEGVLSGDARLPLATEVYIPVRDDDTAMAIVQTITSTLADRDLAHRSQDAPIQCYVALQAREHRQHLHTHVKPVSHLQLHSYDRATATAREVLQHVSIGRFDGADPATVGVVLIGWTPRTKALLAELCFQMHYLPDDEREIVVITTDPDAARTEFYETYPAVDPETWADESTVTYVKQLFPTIRFMPRPRSLPRLFDATGPIADVLTPATSLTLFVDKLGELRPSSVVAAVQSRLAAATATTDTELYYFTPAPDAEPETVEHPAAAGHVPITSFTHFWDGETTTAIKGQQRDRLAKQLAVLYFLLYEYTPGDTERSPAGDLLAEAGVPELDAIDRALASWDQLSSTTQQQVTHRHWLALAEAYRDSNRHAADHVVVKQALAARLTDAPLEALPDAVLDQLTVVEHQRWAAERLLDGWEPLPESAWDNWDDPETRAQLKAQRYHRDLYPLERLQARFPDETHKDESQIRIAFSALSAAPPADRS